MENYSTNSSYFALDGKFLLLSIWGKKGYDIAAIAAKSENSDRATCPVLGPVYRVRILSTGQRSESGTTGKYRASYSATGQQLIANMFKKLESAVDSAASALDTLAIL